MKKRVFPLVLSFAIVALAVVRAGSPFFPLAEVRPGLKGTGYTVVAGTAVRSFGVEVLGVVRGGEEGNFVLIKVSGSIFRETKGIAAGMSGSPVFISGRLLGAISYAFDRADPRYGLVTPIEEMLRLWERGMTAALARRSLVLPGRGRALPVITPLLVSAKRVPAWLTALEPRLGLRPMAVGPVASPPVKDLPAFVPGSAVAAVFARGDYSAVAIGTVTWVDGRRFLAFGHPLANQGAVDYPAAVVYIYRVIASTEMPFKLGAPLAEVGRFIQDRGAGAGGMLMEEAETIEVEAVVEDRDAGRRKTFRSFIVREPALFRSLALAALLDAVDRTLDEYTPGTAQVSLSLWADGLEEPLRRENLFYSDKDIAVAALGEVGEAVDLLMNNEFSPVTLRKLRLEASFTTAPLVARIVGAKAAKDRVCPGEKLRVEVELRPFRQPTIKVPFTVELPANLAPGRLVLTARGGFLPSRKEEKKEEGEEETGAALFGETTGSLAEAIRSFTNRARNNELILEYLPLPKEFGPEEEVPTPVSMSREMAYVIQGQTQVILEVVSSMEEEKTKEKKPEIE